MTTSPRPPRTLLAVVLVVATLVAACSASSKNATTTTTRAPSSTSTSSSSSTTTSSTVAASTSTTVPGFEPLDWSECDGGFDCAEIEVPVDYAKPDGRKLELALSRRPATDPDRRIGALLMNPGGPGGSAIDFIEGSPLPAELTERFDIVGFDPRGVGRSSPLNCRTHLQDIYQVDPTPDDQAERDTFVKTSQRFVDECAKKYEDLLPFLGTLDVARDMDQVRAALGEDQISYVGYSYGTSIGQQYAKAFPTRVRAMVLDGVVDSSVTGLAGAAGQAKGFTRALDSFIEACDIDDCGLKEPAGQLIDEVIAAAEEAPIPAGRGDHPASPGVVSLALGQALYSETLWPQLARALTQAGHGDGNGMVGLADQYLQRRPDGTYPNGFEIYFAVSCIDSIWPKDPDVVFDTATFLGTAYPRVGEALVNDYVRCALWPVAPKPVTPVTAAVKGLPPIVVISTTGDPATPYESGVEVAKQIPGAVLVTNQGEGHTVFGQGKPCIDDAVTTYLTDLQAPKPGLDCA